MGNFDKKRAFSIGGGLAVLASIIAVAANISEIIQLFRHDEPAMETSTTSIVETVEENTKAKETKQAEETIVEEENVAEVVEVSAVEPTEVIEETIIEQEEIIEPETEPPTEPKPVSVYIVDLEYMSRKNSVFTQNILEDNIGNIYHNGLYMCCGVYGRAFGEGSADYYIQGKYTDFSGIIAVPDGNESDTNRSASFAVYGDGNLLYTSPIMTNTSFPESFSIDITDVQLLTISYPDSNTNSEMATIYDGLLS